MSRCIFLADYSITSLTGSSQNMIPVQVDNWIIYTGA